METQLFHHAKIMIFNKSSIKKNPKSLRYYNSMITNLKFQHKPKYHLSKMLILKNRPNITLGAKIH